MGGFLTNPEPRLSLPQTLRVQRQQGYYNFPPGGWNTKLPRSPVVRRGDAGKTAMKFGSVSWG